MPMSEPAANLYETQRLRRVADKLRESGDLGAEEHQVYQNKLAAKDRGFYAESEVGNNPLNAALLLAEIPAYAAYKKLTGEGRSVPSLDTMAEGYRGIGRGLKGQYQRVLSRLLRNPQRVAGQPSLDSAVAPPSAKRLGPADRRNKAEELLDLADQREADPLGMFYKDLDLLKE